MIIFAHMLMHMCIYTYKRTRPYSKHFLLPTLARQDSVLGFGSSFRPIRSWGSGHGGGLDNYQQLGSRVLNTAIVSCSSYDGVPSIIWIVEPLKVDMGSSTGILLRSRLESLYGIHVSLVCQKFRRRSYVPHNDFGNHLGPYVQEFWDCRSAWRF